VGDGTYRLSLFGSGTALVLRRMDVTLQRATLDLAVAPVNGTPVVGITADGASRLTLTVTSHGIRSDSVSVVPLSLGEFERIGSGGSPLTLDKSGNGTLVYVPPNAVPAEALTDILAIGSSGAARVIPAAPVSFTIRYVDLDGVARTASASVKVCRPPVLLIQSLLGGSAATWTKFAEYARANKLDGFVSGEGLTWSPGNAQISEWGKDVAARISEARTAYESSGIQIAAVDVVAHSVAGLAVRSLLEGPTPRRDVHRLILVGTPNHGIAWLDQEIGAPAVRWLDAHPAAAAELAEGSTFLRGLNPATIGDGSADYVNVIGRRPSGLSGSRQGAPSEPDDGIVSAASAHLDGVPDVLIDGVVHAPGLLGDVPSLMESADVWSRLVSLLVGTVPDAEPDALQFSLRAGSQVSASLDPQTLPWTSLSRFPSAVGAGIALRTGDAGYASLAISRSGQTWGVVSLDERTEVVLRASWPSLVRLEVMSGRVRLRVQDSVAFAGNFEVVLLPGPRGTKWYLIQPDARVLGAGSDLVVSHDDIDSILALEGPASVEYSKGAGFSPARLVEGGKGIRIRSDGKVEDEAVPARGWWSTGPWNPAVRFPYFHPAVMGVCLAALALALVYHIRARRAFAERSRQKSSSADQKP